MNRIRELRRKMGLSSDELAEAIGNGTKGATIRRLELGQMQLTEEWMRKISEILECAPADLLAITALAEIADEVELVESGPNGIAAAIRRKGLEVYKVNRSTLGALDIGPGDIITVDTTQDAIANADSGDVVLVSMRDALTLRQYIKPGLITTNRTGHNVVLRLDDPSVPAKIVGVVILA